jgi:hypothetical protein
MAAMRTAGVDWDPCGTSPHLLPQHGQIEHLALVALGPADVLQEPEVFAELQTQSLGLGEVLGPLQRYEEVLEAAEVIADQLIEPLALVAVDGRDGVGHDAPSR